MKALYVQRRSDLGLGDRQEAAPLLLVDPEDGHITQRFDEPAIDGDRFGPVDVDSADNIYMHVYRSDSQLVFDRNGSFLGRMTQPTRGNVAAPVFLPDGRGYLFTATGMVELTVSLAKTKASDRPAN